jgi:hypothetical protein
MSGRAIARRFLNDRTLLASRWEELRVRYAPYRDAIWSFSSRTGLKGQGWKLHLSATAPYASDLLRACAQTLVDSQHAFKIIASFDEIERLNMGVFYGRSQVGKLVTVYCPEPRNARALAERLHTLLKGIPCPEVPSDHRFRPASNVFYRYGAYEKLEIEHDGRQVLAYRDKYGNLVPDRRTSGSAVPEGISNPFLEDQAAVRRRSRKTTPRYRARNAIHWRGDGGVYRVLDTACEPPLERIMKVGLRHGGVTIDGRDGVNIRKNEFRALNALHRAGIPVPVLRPARGDRLADRRRSAAPDRGALCDREDHPGPHC